MTLILPSDWDPKAAADRVLAGLFNITESRVKGAHDAEMVVLGDHAYVVAEANDQRAGESADWPFVYVVLTVVDLTGRRVGATFEMARGGQCFANVELPPGACFVPRIARVDGTTLRCFFASEAPGQRQSRTFYRDFDLTSGSFADHLGSARLRTAAGTFEFEPRWLHEDAVREGFARPPVDFGLYLFDSFKRIDDRWYVALNNYPGGQNALARVDDDWRTFEVLGHYNQPSDAKLTESAVNRLPDGTWLAICRREDGDRGYLVAASPDGRAWSATEPHPWFAGGTSSKPTFDRFGDLYYLGWQDAATVGGVGRSIFNLDISADGRHWERKYRFETEHSFQYPTFAEHQGAIWLTVTQGDHDPSRKERIVFGRLE